MAAANPNGVFMLQRAALECGQQRFNIRNQNIGSAGELHVQCGVQNVGAGHALMYKTRHIPADNIGQMGQKGDDVVFCDRFNGINFRHVELYIFCCPNRIGIGLRNHAQFGLCIAGMCFDFIPDAEFRFG